MDNKLIYVAVAVIALAVIGVAATTLISDDTDMSSETDGIRVTIYGNANGDDVIDVKDKMIIEKIIDDGINDWKDKYIYADANQDGKITSADATVIQKYIDREETTLYYKDYFGNVAHIPYPIGDKVGVDHPYPALLMATAGIYDKLSAVD
ncbi:MAG: dockerin type I repeat-containing protein, partial [Candidatus Methanomethylophilaceae archaeon]|nr:dockerin type I repeat-containing protein [Candidatus Methanomethylophilaceae archaeon]